LSSADVVRHPLVARIVDAYDRTNSGAAGLDDVVDAAKSTAASARRSTAKSRNGS
jgi:phosphate starvation-inducible PhoH-like protein